MTESASATVDQSWKGLYRWGGLLALLVGVLYFAIIALALAMGTPPTGTGALLEYYNDNAALAYGAFGLAIVSDIMLAPVVFALYLALRGINKNAMLVASGFGGLFLVLDMGVTGTAAITLVNLGQNYAAAATDIQRTAYLAMADNSLAIVSAGQHLFSSAVPSLWGLIASLVMLKGIFSKATAYVGIAGSIVGLAYVLNIFVPALTILLPFEIILFGIFFLLAGSKLYGLGKR